MAPKEEEDDNEAKEEVKDGTEADTDENAADDGDVDAQQQQSLIDKAEELAALEQLVNAARLLRRVPQDSKLLTDRHRKMMRWATKIEDSIVDLLRSPEEEEADSQAQHNDDDGDDGDGGNDSNAHRRQDKWTKQTESHGFRDFFVYYKVKDKTQLISRIDCAVESSLLVPILAVFNESELFKTWMPSYKRPIKIGVQETNKLAEYGRGNQLIQVVVGMGWPWNVRESIQHAWAVDMIDETGAIAIQVLGEGPEDDPIIPAAKKGVVRIDFDATILIQACPSDHPCLRKSKHRFPDDEPLIMFSMKQMVDAHVTGVPVRAVNFISRTVIGRMWSNLLQVATDIRDGKRPLHAEAIASKSELYDWVRMRTDVMVSKMREGKAEST